MGAARPSWRRHASAARARESVSPTVCVGASRARPAVGSGWVVATGAGATRVLDSVDVGHMLAPISTARRATVPNFHGPCACTRVTPRAHLGCVRWLSELYARREAICAVEITGARRAQPCHTRPSGAYRKRHAIGKRPMQPDVLCLLATCILFTTFIPSSTVVFDSRGGRAGAEKTNAGAASRRWHADRG